jgi:hypothetical protein
VGVAACDPVRIKASARLIGRYGNAAGTAIAHAKLKSTTTASHACSTKHLLLSFSGEKSV